MENSILSLDNADIYQRDNLVLSKVNLTINKGDFYYLIGNFFTILWNELSSDHIPQCIV